jgi:3-hydroxyacyl-[acyl-carrier-protein] dehydratase
MRYFLLDRIIEIIPGTRARGIKCVTLSDEVMHDHFPDYPIFPGVLMIEAAAQLAGFLLETSQPEDRVVPLRAVLAQIQRAKFHRPARPGDAVELTAEIQSSLDTAAQLEVRAEIGAELAMRGTLTFMLKAIDSQRVHEQRRYLYRLWTRALVEQGVEVPIR